MRFIKSGGFESVHVLEIAFAQSSDAEICRYAESHDYVLVSKDEGFFHLALKPGAQIRLVWVRIGNCRNQILLDAFERAWPRVVERLQTGERSSNCDSRLPTW
jgi:predicted nuclease of predicted toxin-antitoxin system